MYKTYADVENAARKITSKKSAIGKFTLKRPFIVCLHHASGLPYKGKIDPSRVNHR